MSKVYVVRHGQTAWNVGEIFRGRADIPLDETGKQEVHLAGEALKDETIHAVYSSPLSRSMETAENIAKFHKISVTPFDPIIDISYGEWEGLENQAVKEKYPELHALWHREPHKVKFPGGESLDEVRSRIMKGLEDLLVRHKNENFVLVAHRVPNKVICCADLAGMWDLLLCTAWLGQQSLLAHSTGHGEHQFVHLQGRPVDHCPP